MHDGCAGPSADGKAVVDKVRLMGFATLPLLVALLITCAHCGTEFQMVQVETSCPG